MVKPKAKGISKRKLKGVYFPVTDHFTHDTHTITNRGKPQPSTSPLRRKSNGGPRHQDRTLPTW